MPDKVFYIVFTESSPHFGKYSVITAPNNFAAFEVAMINYRHTWYNQIEPSVPEGLELLETLDFWKMKTALQELDEKILKSK